MMWSFQVFTITRNRLWSALLGLLFSLCLIGACMPIGVKQDTLYVVDAESRAPLANATIDLYYYPSSPTAPGPTHPQVATNAQGEITVQVRGEPAIWQVRAPDYIEQRLVSTKGEVPTRYAAQAPAGYAGVIHLYHLPQPQLTLLISATYTGPVTIKLQPAPGFGYVSVDAINVRFAATTPDASYRQAGAGQRVFTATVSAEGVVDLVVTPLLYDLQAQNIQIRDRSGLLPYRDLADLPDEQRAVWGSVTEDDKQIYHQIRLFVGTRQAYLAVLGGK